MPLHPGRHLPGSDPDQIVAEALAPILAMGTPALAIFFCSPAHDLAAISSRVKQSLGDVEVIGCSTAGELLVRDQAPSGGLLIRAMGGDGFAVTTGFGPGDADKGLLDAAFEAAQCIERLERKQHTILWDLDAAVLRDARLQIGS
ncbi:MAG: hypothetical protein NTY67_15045 [Cyanobacteria bacterium]|nr:hypothetical protein [Cyanobacteriota bacterium]